ncbi:transmembrane emp24 domain-containing protein 7 [Trichonephila inaurata madagascariensis]|uniref:Transmembrane emp24 domain-containing protein 7 n=1 Tax=Trichonephila inaurata madagascariensis TaxID=2747483 RepID=A0A8X6XFH6_9ARAC|nr:transmembrane emp24 domain-containing protein 7 [Trichonephila inaurata madagascariensis]
MQQTLCIALLTLFCINFVSSVELTFELPDNAKQCFHEDIQQGVKSTIEFQVVTGGHYDVDAVLEAPSGQVLYKGIKKQSDSYTWVAEQTGVYKLCFSNEFSTFSHKLVYVDFVVGEEKPLPGVGEHLTAMTKLETSSSNVHEHLNTIIDYQTHHRLMEAQGRKRAEDLNTRVMYWSMGETVLIILIAVGQVMVLRNFFSEKKGTSS